MPSPIADVYRPLWQEVQNIHFTWSLNRQLFGTSPQRIDLLNRFGGIVFSCFQRLLRHHVPLSIFRLLDPATQRGGKDENLCLERLVTVVKADCPPLGDKLSDLLAMIRGHMTPFENLRNKVIAHNDLPTTPTLFDGTSTVFGPSREVIETVLGCIRRFMNAVQSHYGEGETYYYDFTVRTPGDGETLIRHLTDLAARIGSGWEERRR
jgi:hypothetical protein